MNHYLVTDCSFIMADLLPDEEGTFCDMALFNIYVPSIFYLECTNILNIAFKLKRINAAHYDEYLSFLHKMPVTVDQFSSQPESIHSITKLCQQFELTAYDASYLELAIRLNAKVGSKDQKLLIACARNNISTL